jgi:hypothetical protein
LNLDLQSWATIIGVIIPMITIAGSAVAFIFKAYRDAADAKRAEFFALMDRIDTPGTIAGKVAAVYQLRYYPEHKEFIVRFCRTQRTNIKGDSAQLLADEMDSTERFFSR